MDHNLEIKTLRVCRICMEEITDIPFLQLDYTQVNTEPTIRQKFSNCIPELDLSIVQNARICETCADTINFVYNFKNKCLRSELQIHKYIQQLQHTGDVDLEEVAQFNRLRCVKTEDIEVTETFKYQEAPTLFSDDTAFNDTECTHNKYLLTLQKVERDCVLFNTDDLFLNYSNPATEDNSNTSDNSNILRDCITQMVDNRDGNVQDLGTTVIFYECYTCGHKTKSKSKLILHMKSHTDKKLHQNKIASRSRLTKYNTLFRHYKCCLCNYLTKYKWSLSFHVRTHLTKKNKLILNRRLIKTNQSSITFKKENKDGNGKSSSRSYNKQVLKTRSNCLRKYLKSKRQFSQRDNLKPNMEAHMANKLFECSVCEYKCRWKGNLKVHMQIHTREKQFNCSVCEYQCSIKSYLKRHMQIHTGNKPFTCSICEFQCREKYILKQHILIHTSEKPFTCSVCGFQSRLKCYLKDHMRIHTGDKPFTCSVCKYQCRRKRDLKQHMSIHTGEKRFACSACEYKCRSKSNLKRHVQIHTDDKPFTCSVCEYQCRWKSYFKVHMRIHTGDKQFTCSVCQYQCIRKGDLKKHMLIHTGENPFACSVCEYKCKRKNYLKRHMKKHSDYQC